MENSQDFEAPAPSDDATEIGVAVDPFGGYEPPQEESHAPQQSPPPAPQPPVQPARDPYDDYPWLNDVQDIETYTQHIVEEIGKSTGQMLADRRLYERVESAEARAIEAHNGEDGLPSYSELADHYAVPFLRQQPVALRQLVLSQPNPAEAAFLVGFCCRYPRLIPDVVARNGKIDASIFRSANFRPTVREQGGRGSQGTGRLSAAEINAMSPIDFETQVLDPFKMSSEGE